KVSNQALTTLVNPQLKQHMAYWESELAKSEWFAGNDFTAADIPMSFPREAAWNRGTPRRWRFWSVSTLGRPMRAHWKRVDLIRSDGSRYLFVIARSKATKQSILSSKALWIASRSLSSGAHSRDPLARNDGSSLRRGDHFLDQSSEAADVAGGVNGIAEPYDDKALRRQDDDSLAEIAGREESVLGNAETHAPLGIFMLAS